MASCCRERGLIEKGVNLKLSGTEVYYTNTLLLVVKNMLRSKLHYQKDLNLIWPRVVCRGFLLLLLYYSRPEVE